MPEFRRRRHGHSQRRIRRAAAAGQSSNPDKGYRGHSEHDDGCGHQPSTPLQPRRSLVRLAPLLKSVACPYILTGADSITPPLGRPHDCGLRGSIHGLVLLPRTYAGRFHFSCSPASGSASRLSSLSASRCGRWTSLSPKFPGGGLRLSCAKKSALECSERSVRWPRHVVEPVHIWLFGVQPTPQELDSPSLDADSRASTAR